MREPLPLAHAIRYRIVYRAALLLAWLAGWLLLRSSRRLRLLAAVSSLARRSSWWLAVGCWFCSRS